MSDPTRSAISYQQLIFIGSLMTAIPATFVALWLIWTGRVASHAAWGYSALLAAATFILALGVRSRLISPLRTLSNMLLAVREGDYSIRGREARHGDALGEVFFELNSLIEALHEQRLDAIEAARLLRKVMEEIDVSVFTFDDEMRLRLVNRAGERLLQQPAERLLGRSAGELGLAASLQGDTPVVREMAFPLRAGRWELRHGAFRQRGVPHQLLVATDLSKALREEERQAWQRLLRVLGHELNNSLTPIKSMAATLETLLAREPRPGDWEEDLGRGLHVIRSRTETLGRFMESYSQLARLPQPVMRPVNVREVVERVLKLESRLRVVLTGGPDLTIEADADQLEQLLINLVRNAVDASVETGGSVEVGWALNGSYLDLCVRDEGHGIANPANLFVPFFTTKAGGSGIGLVLSRQIAESHAGTLTLENRPATRGCEARLKLPLERAVGGS